MLRVLSAGVVLVTAFGASAVAARRPTVVRCAAASPAGAYAAALAGNGWVVVAAPTGTGAEVVGILGGQRTVLSDSFDSPPTSISVSPDGEHVVFVKRTGEVDIVSIHGTPLGTDPERMLVPAGPRGSVTSLGGWSDVRMLVYGRSTIEAGVRHGEIYVLDTRTGMSRAIASGDDPAVSPEGSRIAFVAGGGLAWGDELETIRIDGTGRRSLVVKSPITTPVWSPDSSQIAFLYTIDVNPTLDVVSADGGAAREVGYGNAPMFWTETGIDTYEYQEDSGPAVVVVDPSTGAERRLTHVPGRGGAKTVAVSYTQLAYVVLDGDGDPLGVRLVNSDGTNDRPLEPCRGTAGSDRIYGSPLNDQVFAGEGNDIIYVRGGGADFVDCGAGRDTVYADKRDRTFRDCERVVRR